MLPHDAPTYVPWVSIPSIRLYRPTSLDFSLLSHDSPIKAAITRRGRFVPTYQYACSACHHEFEIFQAFTDTSLTHCPECNGQLRKVYSPVGVVFKGSGFYKTDSKSSSIAPASTSSAPSSSSSAPVKDSSAPSSAPVTPST